MSSNPHNRVVVLIDMDCFYVQVEQIEQPEYLGRPCGVAQYNKFKGGRLDVNHNLNKF
jgi:DNA polymerase eta